jgi:hypothetical protein
MLLRGQAMVRESGQFIELHPGRVYEVNRVERSKAKNTTGSWFYLALPEGEALAYIMPVEGVLHSE